jgi:hypothetical protein
MRNVQLQISSANTSPPTNTKVTDTDFFTIEENKTKELEIHFDAAPKELKGTSVNNDYRNPLLRPMRRASYASIERSTTPVPEQPPSFPIALGRERSRVGLPEAVKVQHRAIVLPPFAVRFRISAGCSEGARKWQRYRGQKGCRGDRFFERMRHVSDPRAPARLSAYPAVPKLSAHLLALGGIAIWSRA